ncbi:YppF family protein [Bacillus sp. DX1.1]|uniref:YppF family protein n=1 Tax=unclassified Bacillus (in: firmicutes) TaxID=185979 RepID=UPI0025710DB4|nr:MULTISPECIES: YppF family protein [unclassified Bacillus (in: firmicutes)]MDM5154177.1 YppF family protein [Bacillus sp. DX1.1]WJE83098.1 YppF family protein [Bacillus sp. DX3.1]
MLLGDLKQAFAQKKGYDTEDMNELLDFARYHYLEGKICISEYRTLTRELETIGATKPAHTIVEA